MTFILRFSHTLRDFIYKLFYYIRESSYRLVSYFSFMRLDFPKFRRRKGFWKNINARRNGAQLTRLKLNNNVLGCSLLVRSRFAHFIFLRKTMPD